MVSSYSKLVLYVATDEVGDTDNEENCGEAPVVAVIVSVHQEGEEHLDYQNVQEDTRRAFLLNISKHAIPAQKL